MQFFGKYRGKVESNRDPKNLGRVQVSVPTVLGDGRLSWALPCMPVAGVGTGFFAVPPKGANVWVEFEGGDCDFPIWTGCFWSHKSEVPAELAVAEVLTLQTETVTLTLSDLKGAEGGFSIKVGSATFVLNTDGVELSHGTNSIQMSSDGVNINKGALEIK